MKICSKCKIEKEEGNFSPSQLKKKSSWCKDCASAKTRKWQRENVERTRAKSKKWAQENPKKVAITNKKWRKANPEKVAATHIKWAQANPEKIKGYSRKWTRANPEKVKITTKKWRQENSEKEKVTAKKWRQENSEKEKVTAKKWRRENREKINAKRRDRYQNDPVYRNRCLTSGMVNRMLQSQGGSKSGKSSGDYFPWTSEEYKLCIEALFEPWMNWKNQGVYDPETHHLPEKRTWQLDHIIPQSDLAYKTMDHPNFYKSWSLSNLRPLDSKQNVLDGANRTRHQKKKNSNAQ